MQLIILTVLATVFYSMFVIFAGLAGGKINSWLAVVMYNAVATIIPLGIYLFTSSKESKTTLRGIIYAGLAGVGVLFFSLLLARIFNKGGNLGFVIPTIYGSAIVLTTGFGWLFLKEKVTSLQTVGLALVVIGVAVIIFAKLKA